MNAHSKGGSILCTHLGADVPVCTRLGIFVLFWRWGVPGCAHLEKCTRVCTCSLYTVLRVHVCDLVMSIQAPWCVSGWFWIR